MATPGHGRLSVPLRADENTFERAELLDAATRPADDRAQWVVGHSKEAAKRLEITKKRLEKMTSK